MTMRGGLLRQRLSHRNARLGSKTKIYEPMTRATQFLATSHIQPLIIENPEPFPYDSKSLLPYIDIQLVLFIKRMTKTGE